MAAVNLQQPGDVLHFQAPGICVRHDAERSAVSGDLRQIHSRRNRTDQSDTQEVLCRKRQIAEAVTEFIPDILCISRAVDGRDPLVDFQFLFFIDYIILGEESVHEEIDSDRLLLFDFLSFCPPDSALEKFAVEVVSDRLHVSVLDTSQNTSRAPDLQIAHCNAESASQIRELPDGGQALLGNFPEDLAAPVHQKGICGPSCAADAPAQLIELGKAHLVRVTDDNSIDIGDIQSGLDDRGGYQNVNPSADEVVHDLLQLGFLHLSVGKGHPGLGHHVLHFQSRPGNIVHAVVDIVDLTFPRELPDDRLADHLLIVFHDIGLNGHAVAGRLLQDAHIADSHHAHMERAGDRCGRECQNIHILFHLLDLFLVGDAEALLLVHDQQTQIFKLYILRQKTVRSDDYVHDPSLQVVDRFFLLFCSSEARQDLYIDRETVHSLGKGVVMLLGQDRCGHKNRHLHALLHGLKGRADRNFRLSVADIAADQAVHDLAALHIPLCVFDRSQLIFRLLIREHFLQFPLPDSVFSVDMAFFRLAFCIQFDEVVRDQFHRFSDFSAGIIPLLCAQLVEFWLAGAFRRRVFLQNCQIRGHDKEDAAGAVFDLEIIPRDMIHLDLLDPPVDSDSIVLMDYVIPDAEIREIPDLLAAVIAPDPLFLLFFLSENIRFRKDRKAQIRIGKSLAHPPCEGHDISGFHGPGRIITEICGDIICCQILRESFCTRL